VLKFHQANTIKEGRLRAGQVTSHLPKRTDSDPRADLLKKRQNSKPNCPTKLKNINSKLQSNMDGGGRGRKPNLPQRKREEQGIATGQHSKPNCRTLLGEEWTKQNSS
jgi:hypothetical protein